MKRILYNQVVLGSISLKKKILDKIQKHFKLEEVPATDTQELTYYDTFDWLLYADACYMIKEQSTFKLMDFASASILCQEEWHKKKAPTFWQDFSSEDMKNCLYPLITHRALIPLATIKKSIEPFKVFNNENEVIAEICFEDIRVLNSTVPQNTVSLLTVRITQGYKKEFKSVVKYLEKHVIHVDAEEGMLFDFAMRAIGKCPLAYSAKLKVKLGPTESAAAATQEILSSLLTIITKNDQGVKNDIDSEFLHDFRVSIRKIRSALNQIKYIFSEEITNQCKDDFTFLGKSTNKLRDMDVYLLKQDYYLNLLPEEFQADLLPFFTKLKTLRKREQQHVAELIGSEKYQNIISHWESFFTRQLTDSEKAENSDKPILGIAKKSIYKRFKQVITFGRSISDTTPSSELHKLRIQGKKLRYQLEFFTSLFPADDMTFLMNHLKVLQTNLGDYNDLSTQVLTMEDYLASIKPTHQNSIAHAAAVGALIGQLNQLKQEKRHDFHKVFQQFDTKPIRQLFKELFKG